MSDKEVSNKKFDLNNLNSADAADVFKSLINARKEYEIVKEQETTKRQNIESNLKKYINTLVTKREIFEEVLKKDFQFRRENVDKIFSYLERAFNEGKDEIAIAALDKIEGIVKESPLRDIDKIGAAFQNDDEDLEI